MSLAGNVQTDDQRAIPGAAVTVIHISSGARYAAAADAAGRFTVANLQAGGPYIMRVGAGGYQPQTLENIFLKQGKPNTFTVTLSRAVAVSANTKGQSKRQRSARPSAAVAPAGPEPPVAEASGPAPVAGGSAPMGTHTAPAPRWPRAAPASAAPTAAVASTPPPAPASTETVAPAPTATPAPASSEATAQSEVAVVSAPTLAPTAAVAPAPRRYLSRRSSGSRVSDFIVPGHYDAESGNYIYDTGEPTSLKLANGTVIAGVGINSTESNLYHFITDPQMQVDTINLTRGWYNFDRVFFNTGKATLTLESVHQLRNIATIMQAYPHARIKLGGYTDSTGTYQVNKQLSEARARTAWASLVEMGVSPGRIEARGYGPRYSIAPNTSDEGRAMNRRLSLKVLRK